MPRKKKGVFSFGRATPLANEHKRFGGRVTRQNSKLGKAISLQRLEKLLRQKKASGSDAPDKAALKAALEEKRIQDEKDQKEEAPAASTSSPVESPPSLEEVEDKKEDIEMIEEKV